MKDLFGSEFGVGDKVLYAGLAGRTAKLSRGFVVGVEQDYLRIVRLEEWSTNTEITEGSIRRLDNVAVVGSVPAVSVDAVVEAVAAIKDARKKAYAHDIEWSEYRDTERVAVQVFKDLWG